MARYHLDLPVIIMTGSASVASVVEALRKGAYDYLRKPFEPEALFTSVKNAFRVSRLKKDNEQVIRKLRESEERYRLLIENQGEGVGIVDLDEIFVFCNPAAEQMFDVPPGMLISRNLTEFINPEDLKKTESGYVFPLKDFEKALSFEEVTSSS